MPELFSVNQLAEELGVTPRAIRFYEVKGLIAPRRAGTPLHKVLVAHIVVERRQAGGRAWIL